MRKHVFAVMEHKVLCATSMHIPPKLSGGILQGHGKENWQYRQFDADFKEYDFLCTAAIGQRMHSDAHTDLFGRQFAGDLRSFAPVQTVVGPSTSVRKSLCKMPPDL